MFDGEKRHEVKQYFIDILHQDTEGHHIDPAGNLAIYFLLSQQQQHVYAELLDKPLRHSLLPKLRTDKREDYHVSKQ